MNGNNAGNDQQHDDVNADLSKIILTITDPIIILNGDNLISLLNNSAQKLFCFTSEELVGKHINTLVNESQDLFYAQIINNESTSDELQKANNDLVRVRRKNSSCIDIQYSIIDLTNSIGARCIHFTKVKAPKSITDVALEENQQRLQAMIDSAVDAIITINAEGEIESFNPAASKLFGYQLHEVLKQNVKKLMPPPYSEEHDEYLGNFLKTGKNKIIGIGREIKAKHKDGHTFPIHLSVNQFFIKKQPFFTGIIKDITKIKLIEEQLKKRNKEIEKQSWVQQGLIKLYETVKDNHSFGENLEKII